MSIYQNIIDGLKNQGANPDLAQVTLIKKLCDIKIRDTFFIPKFSIKSKNQGLYIWGDVGRGKTLIVNEFIKHIKEKNVRTFHYIDFMNFIHDQLNKNSGSKDPLKRISSDLSRNKLIFIDEFQVEDVADAMIIGEILKQIKNHGTKVVLTSNAHPDDLYKDGLQRQKFIHSIKIFLENITIHRLEGDIDYRSRNIIQLDSKNDTKIYSDEDILMLIKENFGLDKLDLNKIEINDREFGCNIVSNSILWIEYSSFFREPTGPKDYEFICKKFDWIFISKFQKGDDESIDIVRRFISFIDISYASKTKIKFFYNEIDINEIYSGSKIDLLWSRCASRLSEMRTYKYLNNY